MASMERESRFIRDLFANVVKQEADFTIFKVPTKREKMYLRVKTDLIEQIRESQHLEKMLKTLLSKHRVASQSEEITISQGNYRLFM